MKTVTVPDSAPRNAKEFKPQIPFLKGLKTSYYLSWFFAFGMLLPLVTILVTGGPELLKTMQIKLFVAFGIFLVVGGFMFAKVQKRYLTRIKAFEKGKIITGKVIDQGRSMVVYSSLQDYTITIEFKVDKKTTRKTIAKSRQEDFHQLAPIGTEVKGFWDAGGKCVFFPVEVGIQVES